MTNDQRINAYITAIVSKAPPLTAEQIRRLRGVFTPAEPQVEVRARRAA